MADVMDQFKLLDRFGQPFKIEVQQKSTRRDLTKELGSQGVTYFGGLLSDTEEHNSKLTGPKAIAVYNEMRRSDASIAEILNAWSLPVLGANPVIEIPEDEGEADRVTDEHIEFVEHNLFTRIDFKALLQHALSSIWAGFAWFEKVYEVVDGKLMLRCVSPRLASTIDKWYTDDKGELIGVRQEVYQNGKHEFIDIPRDKIVLFTFRKEANNHSGNSLLRPLYSHYFIKQSLYKIDAIRQERFAIGVPVITLPETYDEKLFDLATQMGKNWRGAEQAYVVKLKDMDIEIMQMDGAQALDLVPIIQHHNEMIARGALAGFMNLGHTQTGSRSLGEVNQEFFYDALEAMADWVAETLLRDLIWPTLDLNFPNQPRPTLQFNDLGSISMNELILALQAVGKDFITKDFETENHIRERLGLPLKTEEDFDEQNKPAPPPVPIDDEDTTPQGDLPDEEAQDEPLAATVTLKDSPFWRELRPEEEYVQLRQIAGFLDDSQDRILRTLLSVRDQWADSLVAQAERAIPQGPDAIRRMGLNQSSVMVVENQLKPILMDLYQFGQAQVKRELEEQAHDQGVRLNRVRVRDSTIARRQAQAFRNDDLTPDDTLKLISARIFDLLARLARKTEEAARRFVSSVWRTQGTQGFEGAKGDIRKEITTSVEQEAKIGASNAATEALNLGRDAESQRFKQQIQTTLHSAVMDSNTCRPCRRADGFEAPLGSPEYYDTLPPLNSRRFGQCEGRGRCRDIKIYLLKEGR